MVYDTQNISTFDQERSYGCSLPGYRYGFWSLFSPSDNLSHRSAGFLSPDDDYVAIFRIPAVKEGERGYSMEPSYDHGHVSKVEKRNSISLFLNGLMYAFEPVLLFHSEK